ncbi:AAA family ATPase [Actinopolymorpha alba]|uniref:AAA family ATPase n=1 Tax=Actinopolymorpha alba TaxID=533267 RepID=UPI00037B297C|nr:AAA family ATPase [Actinopolymorpha alba]
MDLVYLYGPPAVGKLTVATVIAERTGYPLFHNHLSIDCVRPVFDFGSEPFWRQVHAIREGIIAEAAREGRDLVFTTVYNHPDSAPQTNRRFEAVESNGGRVCLVQLTCSREALEARVRAEHRSAMGKVATVEHLRRMLGQYDMFAPIPGRDSLHLDTSDFSATDAAERVIEHYQLSRASLPPIGVPTRQPAR